MDKSLKQPHGRPPWGRRLVGLAGMSAGVAVLAVVVTLYADAARMTWLAPTPDNLASIQPCDGVQGTAARQHCVQTVIAEARGRDTGRRLAARDPEPDALSPAR